MAERQIESIYAGPIDKELKKRINNHLNVWPDGERRRPSLAAYDFMEQDTTFILSVLANDLRAEQSWPRSCRRPRHLCTQRLGSMPPCGSTCKSICGTGAASCSRRCGATATNLSRQPIRQFCLTVSVMFRHFWITSDRTNGRQRDPRTASEISSNSQQDKRRPDAVKTTHEEQKAAAAKQDGDERAESQPQRRRRCMAVCPGCGYILNDEDATRCRRCCAAFFEPSDDGVSANDTEVELPVLFGEACAALGRGDQEHENPVLRSGDRNQRAPELRQGHRRRKKTQTFDN